MVRVLQFFYDFYPIYLLHGWPLRGEQINGKKVFQLNIFSGYVSVSTADACTGCKKECVHAPPPLATSLRALTGVRCAFGTQPQRVARQKWLVGRSHGPQLQQPLARTCAVRVQPSLILILNRSIKIIAIAPYFF